MEGGGGKVNSGECSYTIILLDHRSTVNEGRNQLRSLLVNIILAPARLVADLSRDKSLLWVDE